VLAYDHHAHDETCRMSTCFAVSVTLDMAEVVLLSTTQLITVHYLQVDWKL